MTSLRDGVLGVELAALEVATEQPAQLVRARLRDGVDLHTRRTALRGIELVGDELELRDRILAEARLAAAAEAVGDFTIAHSCIGFALSGKSLCNSASKRNCSKIE